MYFLETLQVHATYHGGVLYSFFFILMECCSNFVRIFLNIEKIKLLHIFFGEGGGGAFSFHFCGWGGGGGEGVQFFY